MARYNAGFRFNDGSRFDQVDPLPPVEPGTPCLDELVMAGQTLRQWAVEAEASNERVEESLSKLQDVVATVVSSIAEVQAVEQRIETALGKAEAILEAIQTSVERADAVTAGNATITDLGNGSRLSEFTRAGETTPLVRKIVTSMGGRTDAP